MGKLERSIRFDEQDDGRIEVRLTMRPDQIDLLKQLMFDVDVKDMNQMQDLIFEFGKTLNANDYVGRRCFLCLFSMIQGGKAASLAEFS